MLQAVAERGHAHLQRVAPLDDHLLVDGLEHGHQAWGHGETEVEQAAQQAEARARIGPAEAALKR